MCMCSRTCEPTPVCVSELETANHRRCAEQISVVSSFMVVITFVHRQTIQDKDSHRYECAFTYCRTPIAYPGVETNMHILPLDQLLHSKPRVL